MNEKFLGIIIFIGIFVAIICTVFGLGSLVYNNENNKNKTIQTVEYNPHSGISERWHDVTDLLYCIEGALSFTDSIGDSHRLSDHWHVIERTKSGQKQTD